MYTFWIGTDFNRGVKFLTYATWWVWSSVRQAVTKHQKESQKLSSLDAPLYSGEKDGATLYDLLPGQPRDPDYSIDGGTLLPLFFEVLSSREKVVMSRIYGDMKYTEVGSELNLSRERIRQIEKGALAKLKESFDIVESVGLHNIESPRKL
ncbi:MAG: sigma-70 family RNA polymerase sigma factor [Acidobacteriota bacterium]